MTKQKAEPWKWEKVEGDMSVTEWTLKGPDVLCRYWYDKPPSQDAKLLAVAPVLLEAAILVAEGTATSIGTTPLRMQLLRAAIKAATDDQSP